MKPTEGRGSAWHTGHVQRGQTDQMGTPSEPARARSVQTQLQGNEHRTNNVQRPPLVQRGGCFGHVKVVVLEFRNRSVAFALTDGKQRTRRGRLLLAGKRHYA